MGNQQQEQDPQLTPPPCQPLQVFPLEEYDELKQRHCNGNNRNNKIKVVHFVRHAEGTHNVEQDYKSIHQIDARLTDWGKQQCQALAKQLLLEEKGTRLFLSKQEKNALINISLWTSPMTRCIETVLHSFPFLINQQPSNTDSDNNDDWIRDVPWTVAVRGAIIAHESWRETVNYNCDRRRSKSELEQEFHPHVDFSCIEHDHDPIWYSYRERLGDAWNVHMESAELHVVAQRAWEGLRSIVSDTSSSSSFSFQDDDDHHHHVIVCTHSAFLRCLLNWGQEGGVPKLMPQRLDTRDNPVDFKLLEYCSIRTDDRMQQQEFENYMRRDYENCEMRSFCVLVQDQTKN